MKTLIVAIAFILYTIIASEISIESFVPPKGTKLTVTADSGLNVRDGPCTNRRIITTLSKGSVVTSEGVSNTGCGYTWYKISGSFGIGYAVSDYLKQGSSGYVCTKPCYGNMCCSTPPDNMYYLTTFCDEQTACGIPCSAVKYFAASSQRFGCKKYLNICRGSKCVKVLIIDAGAHIDVERKANKHIMDASKQVCIDLFGSSSCGWSDRREVKAVLASDDDTRPLGPFIATPEELLQMGFNG